MKYSPLFGSVLTLSLLVSGSVPALADDGVDTVVQGSTTVRLEDNHQDTSFPGARFLQGVKDRVRGDDDQKEHLQASSSEARKAEHEDKRIEKGQEKAGHAIDKRIESLTKLKARLANLKLLDATVLASISASLDAEIAKLVALKATIASDTSTTTLKKDVSQITKGLRIFAVVEPKAHIAASASRINAVVVQLNLLADKLQTRITEAKTAGKDVTLAEAALVDLRAKAGDAKVQADLAVSMTVNLQADNGDTLIRASNLKALKDARAKLVIAQQDLAAARHDAGTIRGIVKVNSSATASTTSQ